MLYRREFIRLVSIAGSFLLLLMNSCKKVLSLPGSDTYALTPKQTGSLETIHEHLFPANENSPGAKDINSVGYIKKILSDPQIKNTEKELILYGINWTEETAREMYKKSFSELTEDARQEVLLDLRSFKNGENWLSKNITYILEALLSDPVYGSNIEEAGWKWLKHKSGYPRPDIYTKYQYL